MKKQFYAALVGAVIVTAGCVSTVSDTHSAAVTWSTDKINARYERSLDQVYAAAVTVIKNNGVVLTEYIPHDSTNSVRALSAKVNNRNVWVRVEAVGFPPPPSPSSPSRPAPVGASATWPFLPNW